VQVLTDAQYATVQGVANPVTSLPAHGRLFDTEEEACEYAVAERGADANPLVFVRFMVDPE